MLTNENIYCIIYSSFTNRNFNESKVVFLEEIRKSRKKQGLSQEELAKISGLSRSSIINFETGKRDPRVKDLRKIAKALNVHVQELISDTEQE